jgi:hypothetical protein
MRRWEDRREYGGGEERRGEEMRRWEDRRGGSCFPSSKTWRTEKLP